jgi:hypothetical protein
MDEEALFAHSELPPCAPGHYELSLVCGVFRERRKITVMPLHFTDGDVKSMMNDLTVRLPKSIASLLQKCGGLSGTNLVQDKESTIEQEFLKLSLAMKRMPPDNGVEDRAAQSKPGEKTGHIKAAHGNGYGRQHCSQRSTEANV